MEVKSLLSIAEVIANESSAERLKVGCVVVRDGRIIATGYNGTLPGRPNQCEGSDGATLPEVLHAEENALMFCLRNGIAVNGASIYITHSPCMQCSKLIANSGIKEVWFGQLYRDSLPVGWLRSQGVTTELFSRGREVEEETLGQSYEDSGSPAYQGVHING